jgi:uncharacterized protein with HEPN domain
MLRSAVRGELMVIGEAMNQMLRHFPETTARIGLARRIVDFRNLLIHEYGEVDDQVVGASSLGICHRCRLRSMRGRAILRQPI